MNKFYYAALLSIFIIGISSTTMAASWHYDFNPAEDVSQLTFYNLASPPSSGPTYTMNGNLVMHVPDNTAYDLASWVNLNAPRVYRSVPGEAFTLETKFDTTFSTYSFLSGLFLYNSAGGIGSDDLIFGVNRDNLKIEQGYPVVHTGPYAWTPIGAYSDLYLQVVHDGAGDYDFSYKMSAGDPWTLHASLSGYSFDYLGIITKTWYNPTYGIYPEVDANFDYLNYNHVVPIPGAVWLLGSGLICLIGVLRKKG